MSLNLIYFLIKGTHSGYSTVPMSYTLEIQRKIGKYLSQIVYCRRFSLVFESIIVKEKQSNIHFYISELYCFAYTKPLSNKTYQ